VQGDRLEHLPGRLRPRDGWLELRAHPALDPLHRRHARGPRLDQLHPVGDCDAPFPHASATRLVDTTFTAGMIDATHFSTIAAALTAASPGATIAVAVAPGT